MKQNIRNEKLTNSLLIDIAEKYFAKKIFLVHGKKSFSMCGAKEVFDSAFQKKYEILGFTDFSDTPKWEEIQKGLIIKENFHPDLIFGVGGGSALDVAKQIRFFSAYQGVPHAKGFKKKDNLIPLVLIPTTAGSGAEATHFAVCFENDVKYSVSHDDILSDEVVLDWTLTKTNSDYTTACTGFDALAQAIESYWAVKSTDESRNLAKQAMEIIFPILNKHELYKTDDFRKKMILAANLAGQAINISTTTACHAFSYKITSLLKLPHGHAVAISLPYFFNLNMDVSEENCNDSRGVEFVKERLNEICGIIRLESGKEYVTLSDYVKSVFCGLRDVTPPTGEEWNVIVNSVNAERLRNNPIKVCCDVLQKEDFIWNGDNKND